VAIQLGLSEKQATRYYREYWKLKGLYELHSIYKELKGNLSPVLKLYRLLKREGIGIKDLEWFVNMVNIGTYKVPEIQKQHAKAKDELEVIEYKRVMSKHELDNMNNQIYSCVEVCMIYRQLAITREMRLHIYRIKFKD
jgi:hypothetical protein